jgi:hypothetical protein
VGGFISRIVLGFVSLVCSHAAFIVAHACGWFPDQQVARLLMTSPEILQIDSVRWVLTALLAIVVWALVDHFMYRRHGKRSEKTAAEKTVLRRPSATSEKIKAPSPATALPASPKKKYSAYDVGERLRAIDLFETILAKFTPISETGQNLRPVLHRYLERGPADEILSSFAAEFKVVADELNAAIDAQKNRFPDIVQIITNNTKFSIILDGHTAVTRLRNEINHWKGNPQIVHHIIGCEPFHKFAETINALAYELLMVRKELAAKRREYESAEVHGVDQYAPRSEPGPIPFATEGVKNQRDMSMTEVFDVLNEASEYPGFVDSLYQALHDGDIQAWGRKNLDENELGPYHVISKDYWLTGRLEWTTACLGGTERARSADDARDCYIGVRFNGTEIRKLAARLSNN